MQGKRTVFSTRLCVGGQQWPTQTQPMLFQSGAQRQPCCLHPAFSKRSPETAMLSAPFGCTHPPPPVPPFLLSQNLSREVIAGSDVTRGKFHAGYIQERINCSNLNTLIMIEEQLTRNHAYKPTIATYIQNS